MKSPFPYEIIADSKTFYGRVDEIDNISKFIKTSNNILIHSKRRMGKSTLIQELFRRNSTEYICIYCDIFDITSKEDFIKLLLKGISNIEQSDFKVMYKKFSEMFKRVRVEPAFDANTSKFSLKPIVSTLSFDEMIEDFFLALEEISKDKQVVFAIDEFQQISLITDVKLDALLRKHIQGLENVSWIFLGSKRHLLTSLFEYKAPLYEMATHLELQPLELEEVYTYTSKYINISEELISYVYEVSDSETKLMQNICHILWLEKAKEKISKDDIDEVVKQIVNSKDSSFRLIYDMLNNNQKIALKILAKYKKKIYTQEVLSKFNIKKQTLQSAIKALYEKEICDKNSDVIYIPDRTFELWLEKTFKD